MIAPEEISWEQSELFGEFPVIPVWEETVDKLIVEEEEPPRSYRKPKFQEDFLEGFV